MRCQPLSRAQMLYRLERACDQDLVNAAIETLANGVESPALRELAALAPTELRAARSLFERALSELRIPLMTEAEALRVRVAELCAQIVQREIDPATGAWLISRAALDHAHETREYDVFISLASEFDERPVARIAITSHIILAAERFLDAVPRRIVPR